MRAAGGVDEPPRQRRDAGEALQKIERRPFGGQHRRGRAAHFRDDVARRAALAVAACDCEQRTGIELPERLGRDLEAGDDAVATWRE